MGFWSTLLGRNLPVAHSTPNITYLGAHDITALLATVDQMTVADMWTKQPHLRTVVGFLCRSVAKLGIHAYRRVDDNNRVRDRETVAALLLSGGRNLPNPSMTAYDLTYALVGDHELHDRAYWLVARDLDVPAGWVIRRLPPAWVQPTGSGWEPTSMLVRAPDGNIVEVNPRQIVTFTGYHPASTRLGSPTVEALRGTLKEQIEASAYRAQVWERGGRVSSVLERPKDAPKWSDSAREGFREDWYAKYTGRGSKAGGTPILEDGMTLRQIDFSAKDQQYVEAHKLALATVAAAFYVNPIMVGLLDNANYANVREFNRMVYGVTLGPIIKQIEDRLNGFLLPMLGVPDDVYVEFNVEAQLRGTIEEQAAVFQSACGGPWMTRNEARARQNLPAIDGADELIVPLNVIEGGQASPTDSAPPKEDPWVLPWAAPDPVRS